MDKFNKIDEGTMEVIKSVQVAEPVKTIYTIDFLRNQELSILKSMNDFVDARQAELTDVRALIDQAVKLGLKTSQEMQEEAVTVEADKLKAQTINQVY